MIRPGTCNSASRSIAQSQADSTRIAADTLRARLQLEKELRDAAIHREWELSLGQRNGPVKAAHLICELHARLAIVGLVRESDFELPINQTEFGECLGLTVVHTNRVLRNLRERGLAEMKARQVVIHDMAGLKALAEFDPVYLYLDRTPR